MATTFVKRVNATGAATSTAQLDGTAVAKAGPRGIVRACAVSSVKTTTFLLKGRASGKEIIPNGSATQGLVQGVTVGAGSSIIDAQHFIYVGQVQPGEDLELTVTFAAADDAYVAVQTE